MEIESTPDKTVEVKTELKTEKPKTENIDLVEKVIEKELPKEDAILHYLGQLSCDFNTSYLTDSCIGFTLKMASVFKNTIFGLKMMVKSGLENFILKSLHAGR